MSDEKIAGSVTGSDASLASQGDIVAPVQTQDVDNMLASFSTPENTKLAHGEDERRNAHRSHVKWHVDIILDDQIIHHGFINDISTTGMSIYLDSILRIKKCKLHIQVPPQNLTSDTRVIEVSGQLVYMVYDGSQQLFRAAFNFLSFYPESDLSYLGKCLAQHP